MIYCLFILQRKRLTLHSQEIGYMKMVVGVQNLGPATGPLNKGLVGKSQCGAPGVEPPEAVAIFTFEGPTLGCHPPYRPTFFTCIGLLFLLDLH